MKFKETNLYNLNRMIRITAVAGNLVNDVFTSVSDNGIFKIFLYCAVCECV
jgi:hypothetical protein